MTDIANVTITPKSDEKREKFFSSLNKYINLEYQRVALVEAQTKLLGDLFEDTCEVDIKKTEHTKIVKLHLKEFFKGEATEMRDQIDCVLDEHDLIAKNLKG